MDTLSKAVNVRWSPDLIRRIDEARGIASRSAWLRQAAEQKLEREHAPNNHPPKEHQHQ